MRRTYFLIRILHTQVKARISEDNIKEKELRGFLRSNVEKSLSQQTVVILDSTNYIKGYRYENYCIARNVKTTHCVVYCNTPAEVAAEWNAKNNNNYAPELFEDLIRRMEVPNSKSLF